MKNNKKKGFTLIELLVVIAILAILATVSVVGYTNFIRKAHVSNDTVIAKELTTLVQTTDITDPVETFEDVIDVLYANGFHLANLNTKTKGCFYVWESKDNQILLVDAENNFEVIFPEKYEPKGATWHLITSDKDNLAGINTTDITVKYAVANSESLQELLTAGEEKVYIDQSFVIKAGANLSVSDGVNVTLVLGDSSLSTSGTINGAPIYLGNNATLTIEGGKLNADGTISNEHGDFNCAIGYDGSESGGTTALNLKGVTFVGVTGINGTWNEDGHVEMVVSDSTFDVDFGLLLSTGGYNSTAEVNNCVINAAKKALSVSQQGTITVNGGTYKGGVNVIYAQDAGTKVIVNGGTFDGTFSVTLGATLTINAGVFSNTGLTLEQFKAYVAEGKTVTENNGVFTVN